MARPINKIQGMSRSVTIDWALFGLFVAGLAWVPYWYGSNDRVAWGINTVLFPGLAAIYEFSLLLRGESHSVSIKKLGIPAALFMGVVLWTVIQNATWTPSSWHHPIWQMAADALGRPVAGSISVNRDLTTLALVRLLTSASAFWVALQLCRNSSRANAFMVSMAAIVSGYAAYGLMLLSVQPGAARWIGNTLTLGFVHSTFYDRSHFATYAGIGLVVLCGLIFQLYGRALGENPGSLRFKFASVIEVTGQGGAALLAGAFLILVAILLTGSRGGLIETGLGLLTLAVLWLSGRNTGITGKRAILAFGLFFVSVVCLAFGNMIFSNLADRGIADQGRLAVDVIMLRSIFAAPLLGYGYGTFVDVFPMFRDQSITTEGIWEQAHNTYLEIFQGLGLVFGSMLIGCVILLVLKCVIGAVNRRDSMIPRVATSVAILVGVQALVDFSLQIQAVTLTFMALLGAGVARSESSRLVLSD